MIFPFLFGVLSPRRAPAAWFLFGVNAFVFIATFSSFDRGQRELDALLEEPAFLSAQGRLFAQMIEREPQLFTGETARAMGRRSDMGDADARDLLGSLALRNPQFIAHAEAYAFEGDEVAIANWRREFKRLRELQAEHPSFRWGLSHLNAAPANWITYQFAHSGFLHLATNMIFLLIFAGFLETRVGSSLVVIGYLGSGLAGAWAFAHLTGLTASPLVGASASISGLGSLVAVYLWGERVPFFYFALPRQGYVGLADFPAWAILILFSIPDLGGYLASLPDVSSVAYAAHLGGAAFGALMAFGLKRGALVPDPYDPARGWQLFEES